MAYCDFCTCGDCRDGASWLQHAPTADGRWICDVCWRYDVCVNAKRHEHGVAWGEKSPRGCGPCEDENGKPVAECGHRPKLAGEFRA